MIVSLHVATGAATGLAVRSRLRALLLGPAVHIAADRVRHEDIASRRFEIVSGLACIALLALRRGPLDASTLGAVSASAPDLEHVVPWLRPRGKKLFHGGLGSDPPGGLPTSLQLVVAGAIVGLLASYGRAR